MVRSRNLCAKIKNAMRVFFLGCAFAWGPISQLSASDALKDCLEPECVSAVNFRTELHRIFLQSDDPVLQLLANKSAEAATSLLANPFALGDNPVLALVAINAIATLTPEQRVAIHTLATDHAFLHLALLSSARTPEERDLILEEALAANNWSEGYIETARLVKKALAKADGGKLNLLMDQDTATLWSSANAGDRKVFTRNLVHQTAISVAAAELPAYQNITAACKELRLLETIHRRRLCKELGQHMERRSNTLITVLIGLAIQKNAAEDAVESAQIETRRTAWREFPKPAFETILNADYENLTSLERAKVDLKVSTRLLEEEEVPALIKLYAQHPQADEALLDLIRAVRKQR